MELKGFNQKDIIFSLDIGTRSIIGTVGIIKDKKFQVVCEKYMEHEERAMVDGQIHDIGLVASVAQKVKTEIEEEIGISKAHYSMVFGNSERKNKRGLRMRTVVAMLNAIRRRKIYDSFSNILVDEVKEQE